MAGDGAVGKTSIVNRFVKREFKTDYSFTVGVDIHNKEINLNGDTNIRFAIWDIAGQDHYNFMRTNFYYGTDGIILVFDLTRIETFDHIYDWLNEITKFMEKEVPFILIGNKMDLIEDVGEVIPHLKIIAFAEKHNIIYRETSAKNGHNIDIIFEDIARKIVKARTYSVDMFKNLWIKTRFK